MDMLGTQPFVLRREVVLFRTLFCTEGNRYNRELEVREGEILRGREGACMLGSRRKGRCGVE